MIYCFVIKRNILTILLLSCIICTTNTISSLLLPVSEAFSFQNCHYPGRSSNRIRKLGEPTTTTGIKNSNTDSTETTIRIKQQQRSSSSSSSWWDIDQFLEYTSQQGIVLSLSTLGPGFRVIARPTHDTTQVLGYLEGFIRPNGKIMHMDKMIVYNKMVTRAKQENPTIFKNGGTTFGIGLLMGYLLLLHGTGTDCSETTTTNTTTTTDTTNNNNNRCTIIEFLAIDDEDFQHKRLVRYYTRSGFHIVKYVGDEIQDIPDRLIWGGCGTLLKGDIPTLLSLWTRFMEKQQNKSNSQNTP